VVSKLNSDLVGRASFTVTSFHWNEQVLYAPPGARYLLKSFDVGSRYCNFVTASNGVLEAVAIFLTVVVIMKRRSESRMDVGCMIRR
jgi:hypothetical protein